MLTVLKAFRSPLLLRANEKTPPTCKGAASGRLDLISVPVIAHKSEGGEAGAAVACVRIAKIAKGAVR